MSQEEEKVILMSRIHQCVLLMMLVLLFIPMIIGLLEWQNDIEANAPISTLKNTRPPYIEGNLIKDVGHEIVSANCTPCHSSLLITQNRATREGWTRTIRWMQQTENLWDLGENESIILDYLAKNYAPTNSGRRPPLTNIEWYELRQ